MGRLAIGDLAVVVAAGTPHRDEAFHACRLAIEAVKHTSPIWKQEHYDDGSSQWSEAARCASRRPVRTPRTNRRTADSTMFTGVVLAAVRSSCIGQDRAPDRQSDLGPLAPGYGACLVNRDTPEQ